MSGRHPVAVLRDHLAAEFTEDLPPSVFPVAWFCGEPQFFPGATGLLTETSWAAVNQGTGPPALEALPPANVRVMVVGNYQASLRSYARILSGEIGGLGGTWGKLKKLLAHIRPQRASATQPAPAAGGHRRGRRTSDIGQPRDVLALVRSDSAVARPARALDQVSLAVAYRSTQQCPPLLDRPTAWGEV